MPYIPHRATILLLFFIITPYISLVQAQTTSNSTSPVVTSVSDDPTKQIKPGTILGAVFGSVIGVALIMVSILYWVRRQTRKAIERRDAGSSSRKNGRYGTQNTSIALDTSFQVPPGISSFSLEKKSGGTVPHSHLYHSYSYAKAPQLEGARPFELNRQGSISISNSPTVPYQIPIVGDSAPGTSVPTAFPPRPSNERPIIRSLHRTNSDIFKPLPEPPSVAPSSGGGVVSTPPPPPVHSVAFPGSLDPNRNMDESEEIERAVTAAGGGIGAEPSRVFGSIGHAHHPYAPYAQDYIGHVRRGSDASTSSLGITLGASGSLARDRERGHWGGAAGGGGGANDSRPRSQSLSSIQYGNSYHRPSESLHQAGSIYKQSASQNPSTTSLSYYPDALSADGLARSYSQTVLARPESRASSITSKKFDNQLFSR